MRMYSCSKYTARLVGIENPVTDAAWNTVLAATDHAIEKLSLPSHIFVSVHDCEQVGSDATKKGPGMYIAGAQCIVIAGAYKIEDEERSLFRIRAAVFYTMCRLYQELAGTYKDDPDSQDEAYSKAKLLNDSFVPSKASCEQVGSLTGFSPAPVAALQFYWMNLKDHSLREFVSQTHVSSSEEYREWVDRIRAEYPCPEGWVSQVCTEASSGFTYFRVVNQ